ncbi:hypothetical protein [Streptomyces niveus]|uniref:hypothetical protein n=1 Tax=Streptomyces niveus TaxID=193462 RepID=UPI00133124A2|nr:hypothetical protein [Streptomyces niveus]
MDGVLPLPGIAAAPLCFIDRPPGRQFVQASVHRSGVGIEYSGFALEPPFDVVQAMSRAI